jgi:hypothetical protein
MILGGATVLVAAMALIGCGGDANPADAFLGTWKYDQSAGTATCSVDGNLRTFDLTGAHKVLREGVSSDLVDTSNCDYRFDVKDKVATQQGSQLCDLGNGDSETGSTSTLTLTSATTMEEVQSANDSLVSSNLGTCTVNLTAHLVRISKD